MKNLLLKCLSIICLLLVSCEDEATTQIDNSPKEMILVTAFVDYDSIAANMRFESMTEQHGTKKFKDTNYTINLRPGGMAFMDSFQGKNGDTMIFKFADETEYANSRNEKGDYANLIRSGHCKIILDTNKQLIKYFDYASSSARKEFNTNFTFPLSSIGEEESFTLYNIPYTKNQGHPTHIDVMIRENDIAQLVSNFKYKEHWNYTTYTNNQLTYERQSSSTFISFSPLLRNSVLWIHLEIAYKNK